MVNHLIKQYISIFNISTLISIYPFQEEIDNRNFWTNSNPNKMLNKKNLSNLN